MVAFGWRESAKLINLCQAQSSPRNGPLAPAPYPQLAGKESANIIIITNPAKISSWQKGQARNIVALN